MRDTFSNRFVAGGKSFARAGIIFIALLILVMFASCGAEDGELPSGTETQSRGISDINDPNAAPANFVDKRYELVSLIFRLAGEESHSTMITKLPARFANYVRQF